MDTDFQKGGVLGGLYYPALQPINKAIKRGYLTSDSTYYVYEPGNATKYEVIFTTYNDGYELKTVMTLANMGKSMYIAGAMTLTALGYLEEKLGLNKGDCYALIPLINHYMADRGQ